MFDDKQLAVEYVPIDRLVPYKKNARTHSDAQVAQIVASIKEFGWTNPILTDGENGIIAGHGRLMAARQLGLTDVPVIELAGLTDVQKQAYVLADNQLALNAGWDAPMLASELQELSAAGFDLDLIGFADLDGKLIVDDGPANNYSRKIEAPIYEITGDKPEIDDLYDEQKSTDLRVEIESADISDDVKKFLLAAADRHTVFDFQNIAEFYAHSDRVTQALMEKSALVIIDFDEAIENGFVKMTEDIIEQAALSKANKNG